eukprot:13157506-Heterocapsa_arctica.AAC.1
MPVEYVASPPSSCRCSCSARTRRYALHCNSLRHRGHLHVAHPEAATCIPMTSEQAHDGGGCCDSMATT